LTDLEPRAAVFERRAREKDPDKKIYGPQMAANVLSFCNDFAEARAHAEELGDALAPLLRERVAAHAAEEQAVQERVAEDQAAEERRRVAELRE
jgi:hypothetical protein